MRRPDDHQSETVTPVFKSGVMLDPVSQDLTPPALADLLAAGERLVTAGSIAEVVGVLRDTARAAIGCEGIAVILKDGDFCFYAAEDAVAPLWQGLRLCCKNREA